MRASRSEYVLVIEDDPATRELYRHALAAYGFRAAAVADGLDALRFLQSDLPDAIVLDLILPRLSGYDVYAELRANRETAHIPVVVVTGSDSRSLEPSQGRLFLRKPIKPDELVAAVNDVIRRSPRSAKSP